MGRVGVAVPKFKTKRHRGQALVEASLLVPMVFFLFLGMTNFGFFVYAFITAGNAARAAAQYTANFSFVGNQGVACQVALREMAMLSNITALGTGSPSSGTWSSPYTCGASPLQVTATNYTEPTFNTLASRVTVTYTTIQLFPLPFMSGKLVINRTATMRLIG